MVTVQQLEKRFGRAYLFDISRLVVEATAGLTKPAEVDLTRDQMDKFLTWCDETGMCQPNIAIEALLGSLLEPASQDHVKVFRENTGLLIAVVLVDTPRIEARRNK